MQQEAWGGVLLEEACCLMALEAHTVCETVTENSCAKACNMDRLKNILLLLPLYYHFTTTILPRYCIIRPWRSESWRSYWSKYLTSVQKFSDRLKRRWAGPEVRKFQKLAQKKRQATQEKWGEISPTFRNFWKLLLQHSVSGLLYIITHWLIETVSLV